MFMPDSWLGFQNESSKTLFVYSCMLMYVCTMLHIYDIFLPPDIIKLIYKIP